MAAIFVGIVGLVNVSEGHVSLEHRRLVHVKHETRTGTSFKITTIELNTEGEVPGIDEKTFLEQAETAKKNCPVSQALAGTEIKLNAKLVKSAAGA